MCDECVFCVTCGAEWNAYSMWNEWIVGDMVICDKSTFALPLQTLLFYNKVYTTNTFCLAKFCV